MLVATTARPAADNHHDIITAAVADTAAIDWQRFIRLVDRHRVAPLAFDALAAFALELPEADCAEFRNRARCDRAHALRSASALSKIASCLDEAGIDAALIKGPMLAFLAFGDSSMRQSRDVDVLVPEDAVVHAVTALESIGCHLLDETNLNDQKQYAVWVRLMTDASLVHAPSGIVIELDWRLSVKPAPFSYRCRTFAAVGCSG